MPGESGVWSAPNRSQELRSRLSASGLEVFPRETSEDGTGASWKLQLRTARFGRMDDLRELGDPTVTIRFQRVELDHGLLVEWFENREQGIEQAWTIATRPGGVDPLWIGLEVEGELHLQIDAGARSGVLVDSTGEAHLCYRDLKAYDATGKDLHAELVSSLGGVGIRIDDAEAIYPLTVDPLLVGPYWTEECNQVGALLGTSVATAGDVNNDGYDDVIVGAPRYDNGQVDEGCAFVYLSSSCCPGGYSYQDGPNWTAEGNQVRAYFGQSVATAGDVNGDGNDDVIIGAPYYDNGQRDEGRAFVYLGRPEYPGLGASPWTAESNLSDAQFGWSVASAGSVNGDAYSDVIVGAPRYDSRGRIDDGRAVLYLGAAGILPSVVLPLSADWRMDGKQTGASFGYSVAPAGDVNGDGNDDVIVGAPRYDNGEIDEGRAFVYLGTPTYPGLKASPIIRRESNQAGALFGQSVSSAGNVNVGDYDDVIIGAPSYDNGQTDEGRSYVYLGEASGLGNMPWTAESNQAFAQFGWSVASAGSVDGDDYSDVIVGAPLYDNGQTNEGRAYVYLAETDGGGLEATMAAWTAESNQAGAQFGGSVATGGDADGDGYSDVIVGASLYDNGQTNEGRVFMYMGSAGNRFQPSFLGRYDSGSAYDVKVVGTVAYVAANVDGLWIVDVSNPAVPTLLGSCDTPDLALNVAVEGTFAVPVHGSSSMSAGIGLPRSVAA